MKLRKYLLVFVVMGLMIPAMSLSADHASAVGTYDYKVSSNVVLDSGGKTVYTGTSFTTALNWALSNANKVTYVPAGTYTLTAHVYFGEGTTLLGDGDSTVFTSTSSHYFYINGVSSVTLSSFKFTGHLQIYGYKAGGTCGGWTFTGVHATALTGDMESAFWMYVGANGIIDGITFTNCTATYSQTYGFLLFGDDNSYSGNSLIENVTFTDCEASHNGNDNVGWVNAWITGYDLVECTSVKNILLTRCEADYNWCSGFHVEYGSTPQNVVLKDCVASYNGQKPNCEQYYGYGFKFQNFQVPGIICINLTGTGNYEGFCPIAMTATSLNMKVWMNPAAGKASTGVWNPAGVPGADSDLIFTKLGSNANCVVDINRKSVMNVYYYVGSITYSTPAQGTVPSVPTNLAATQASGKISLSWGAPANNGGSSITSYSVYRGTAAGSESTTAIGSSKALTYTDSNVVVGTKYYYVVKAVNAVGASAASNEASYSIPVTLPSAPTNIVASQTAGNIVLNWAASASNGGSAITSYNVYRGTAAGSESATAVGTSTTLTYTDPNVVAGTKYYYVVKAVNSAGTSVASNEASYTIAVTAPSAPTNLALAQTSGNISLSWAAPSNNGGSAITSFNVYRGTISGSESATAIWTGLGLTCTDSNVIAGTKYYYVIKAVNAVGASPASNEASYSIPVTAPSAPTNLVAIVTAGNIVLNWAAPTIDGGSSIISYNVYRGTSSGSESATAVGTSTTLTYTDPNVVAGTKYYYVVKAVNSAGNSLASDESSCSIPVTVPSAPTNLAATKTTDNIILTWTTPSDNGGSSITLYNIYKGSIAGSESTIAIGNSTALTFIDLNIVVGTNYYYVVKAVNTAGISASSNEASCSIPVLAPSAPTNLVATVTTGNIALTWTAPSSDGGSAITSYNVYRGTATASESATAIGGSTALTYIDPNVSAGTKYFYVVKAINAAGFSPACVEASCSIPGTVPSAPINLAATQTSGRISLTWTAPASSGSSPISAYSVYRGTNSALTDQVSIASVTTTSYTDTKTLTGTVFYTVKAVNSVGYSPASSSISVIVKAASTVPGKVSGVSAVGSSGQVTLKWYAPANGGSAIIGYKIYRSTASGSEKLVATLGSVLTYTNTGLTNGQTYYYRISAINSVGEGPLSSEVSASPHGHWHYGS